MTENQRVIAGRYEVGNLIGRGGMADVYEGVDTRLGRTVAIKLLKSDLANDPAFEARFRQEAQASARMGHPTIVRIYDAGEEITNHFRLDQNRITLGMGYQIKNLSFQLGYMKQLILANTSNTFKGNNNLQVFIFHNFDCTKKEKSPK